MNNQHSAWLPRMTLVLALLVVGLSVLYYSLEPGKTDGKRLSLCERVEYEWWTLGLDMPYRMQEYYLSVMGSPYRYLTGPVRKYSNPLNPTTLQNIHYEWKTEKYRGPWNPTGPADDRLACTITTDAYSRLFLVWPRHATERWRQYPHVLPPPDRTMLLLTSASAGTKLWKRSIARKDWYLFPSGQKMDRVPAIAFDRPTSQKELDEYSRWLDRMAGAHRFHDDWGHRIRLTLDDKVSPPLLVASSTGPDGRWGTQDDLVLKRDVKSGKIVAKIGFR